MKNEEYLKSRLIDDIFMLMNMKHITVSSTDDELSIRIKRNVIDSLTKYGAVGYRDIKTGRLVSIRIREDD